LIDLGAVIVGKTGMSQFADAEDPTGDCVDFHAPWNPRGDGIRSPGGSSFGAGAATGAYDWIDFALGTDTGGSVRVPAASQSVYGFRPSRGTVSTDGVLLIHSDLDIIGVLSRSFNVVELVSQHLFRATPSITRNSTEGIRPTLIYPAHIFPVEDKTAQDMYDNVVSVLETLLNLKRQDIDFNKEWKGFQTYTEESFEDYFAPVIHDYLIWGQYRGRAAFRAEYQTKFGRQPYVNPLAQLRFANGANMQPDHFKSIQNKREQFEAFIDGIFGHNSFMVTPFKFGEPEARDIYRPAPADRVREDFGWGLRPAFQSPMAGQPEIVFPIGQLPVFSQASQVEEKYGVIASLLGSRGMDTEVLETTGKLLAALKIPTTVLTGRVPF
jgi:Asp-tRNA(Asn)/Glu-tRNA(Gln) amidotransferase A subunit family amidase